MKLTNEQIKAVKQNTNLLLTACPGSGKTRTLVAKLVKEIDDLIGTPRAAACITYTNTAVQEIERRTTIELGIENDVNFSVCTIHSFCLNNILRPFAWKLGNFKKIPVVITPDKEEFEEIIKYAASKINYFNVTRAEIELFESINLDIQGQIIGAATTNEIVMKAAPFFWKRCGDLGFIDFCNIIYQSYCLLRDHKEIRRSVASRFAWILVDEFQDTTELQTEILKLIYSEGKTHFFAVGDPAQSIFGFAGAKPELLQPFATHIRARTDLSLSKNFRSSQFIVDHAERLFPRSPSMQAAGPYKDCSIQPEYVHVNNPYDAISNYFLPALKRHGIEYGEATIIAPNWNMLFPLARKLRSTGIPVIGPGARPYRRSRTFATLAEQLCAAIYEIHSDQMRQLERVLFNTILEATGSSRMDIYSYGGRVTITKLLRRAKDLARTMNGVDWLDSMAKEAGKILTEAEFLTKAESGLLYVSVQEMKADMKRQNIDPSTLTILDLGLFANSKKSLRLSTIHYSKGREYDAVAMIGLREGLIPHFKSTDHNVDKRLFYVGVTRARKYLLYVSEVDRRNGPSRFLGTEGVGVTGGS